MLNFLAAVTIAGTLNLSWDAPTQNTDGSELTNLAGYTVHVGTASGVYDTEIVIPDATSTSQEVVLPINGEGEVTVYVAMKAVNDQDITSDFSNEVQKTFVIQETPKEALPPALQGVEFNLTCESTDARLTCTVTPK